MIQILLYPCAKFLEWALPDWGITVFGTRHSLNPGPWTFKEQMFATITYNIAIYTTNSYAMILVQKMPMYYNETFVTFGYQFMLTLFVQTMGMGLAGYLRRFSVYPVKALWPTILPTIAMNRALTTSEPRETIRAFGKNWTASRCVVILESPEPGAADIWRSMTDTNSSTLQQRPCSCTTGSQAIYLRL